MHAYTLRLGLTYTYTYLYFLHIDSIHTCLNTPTDTCSHDASYTIPQKTHLRALESLAPASFFCFFAGGSGVSCGAAGWNVVLHISLMKEYMAYMVSVHGSW